MVMLAIVSPVFLVGPPPDQSLKERVPFRMRPPSTKLGDQSVIWSVYLNDWDSKVLYKVQTLSSPRTKACKKVDYDATGQNTLKESK
jgi:hypothetical protein